MRLLAFAAGIVVGTVATLVLLNFRPVAAEPPYVEDDDGIAPPDAYVIELFRRTR